MQSNSIPGVGSREYDGQETEATLNNTGTVSIFQARKLSEQPIAFPRTNLNVASEKKQFGVQPSAAALRSHASNSNNVYQDVISLQDDHHAAYPQSAADYGRPGSALTQTLKHSVTKAEKVVM